MTYLNKGILLKSRLIKQVWNGTWDSAFIISSDDARPLILELYFESQGDKCSWDLTALRLLFFLWKEPTAALWVLINPEETPNNRRPVSRGPVNCGFRLDSNIFTFIFLKDPRYKWFTILQCIALSHQPVKGPSTCSALLFIFIFLTHQPWYLYLFSPQRLS